MYRVIRIVYVALIVISLSCSTLMPAMATQANDVSRAVSVEHGKVEITDIIPPLISSIEIDESFHSATIQWTTNEVADTEVHYGLTDAYGEVVHHKAYTTSHHVEITGLEAGTFYAIQIYSRDSAGNLAISGNLTFETLHLHPHPTPGPSHTPTPTPTPSETPTPSPSPSITPSPSVTPTPAPSPTATPSITPTPSPSPSSSPTPTPTVSETPTPSPTPTETPSPTPIPSPSLTPSPEPTPTPSPSETPTPTDTEVPIITGVNPATINTTDAYIEWTTNEPTSGYVEYGFDAFYGIEKYSDAQAATSHRVRLTDLREFARYHYRVVAQDTAGNEALSEDHEFATLIIPGVSDHPPVISNILVGNITETSASISWSTDELAEGFVEYGVSTAYGHVSPLDDQLAYEEHEVLTQLLSDTTYHYRIVTYDLAGHTTLSLDRTFTTLRGVDDHSPSRIADVALKDLGPTSVELHWTVPEDNTGILAYDIRYSTSPTIVEDFHTAHSAQITKLYFEHFELQGTKHDYTIVGLEPLTRYYVAIQSEDSYGNLSSISNVLEFTTHSLPHVITDGGGGGVTGPVSATGITEKADTTAPGSVVLHGAFGVNDQVVLDWDNPLYEDFHSVTIVRKDGDYPASPQDGAIIYQGDEETFTDTTVKNGQRYYYAIYAHDDVPNYSEPILLSVVPQKDKEYIHIFAAYPYHVGEGAIEKCITKTLRFGMRDAQVACLQELLSADKDIYPAGLKTGYFYLQTRDAVRTFQREEDLPVTGVVDKNTREHLYVVFETIARAPRLLADFPLKRVLRRGASGNDVKYLQQVLARENIYSGNITGLFGATTQQAIKKFQTKYELPRSGFLDEVTIDRIEELVL